MEPKATFRGVEQIHPDSVLRIEATLVEGASFAGRVLTQFLSIASEFRGCDFRNMRISQACFGGGLATSTYIDCVFDGSRIGSKAPGFARFERCSFRDVVFLELNSRDVEFVGCTFSGEIRKGYFNGAASEEAIASFGRTRNCFVDNDFEHVKLGDVGFRSGIDLSRQTLPSGEDYLYLPNAQLIVDLANRSSLDIREADSKAFSVLLQLIQRDVNDGQKQFFFNVNAFPPAMKSAFDVIRGLI